MALRRGGAYSLQLQQGKLQAFGLRGSFDLDRMFLWMLLTCPHLQRPTAMMLMGLASSACSPPLERARCSRASGQVIRYLI